MYFCTDIALLLRIVLYQHFVASIFPAMIAVELNFSILPPESVSLASPLLFSVV